MHNSGDRPPAFVELDKIKTRRWGADDSRDTFAKTRNRCADLGLTLERHNNGYYLLGLDLPATGVDCCNLEEVCDELVNYE